MDSLTHKIVYCAVVLSCFLLITSPVSAGVHLTALDENGLSLSYRPHCSRIDSLDIEGKTYSLFNYDNHTMHGAQGEPLLPSTSVFFAAPSGTVPVVETSSLAWQEHGGIRIAPKPTLKDDGYGFVQELYSENPKLYAMSGYRPATFWNLDERATENGLSLWELTLRPLLFDAYALKVAVADSFDVKITFGAPLTGKQALPPVLPDYIINREIFTAPSWLRGMQKSAGEVFDPFGTGEWYRVKVTRTGIYSITGADLAQAGFPVGTTRIDHIRMYYGGGKMLDRTPNNLKTDNFREISIKLIDKGDGIFGMDDSIVFYGSALSRFIPGQESEVPVYQNHSYSTENVYWITISDTGTPKRIQSGGEIPSNALDARTFFPEIIHIEQESYPDFEETGIEWYWDEISGSSKSYAFSTPGIVSGDSIHVKVSFLNQDLLLAQNIEIANDINIFINDEGPFSFYVPSQNFPSVDFRIKSMLKPSGNLLKIMPIKGKQDSFIRLDWLEVEYPRLLEYQESGIFDFYMSGANSPVKMTMTHVNIPSLEIYDTTDPYQVTEITGKVYDAQAKTLTLQTSIPSGRRARFSVSNPSSYLKVVSITRKENLRTSLRNTLNGADYVVIAHKKFISEAQKLASWRSRDSQIDPLKTMVVDVDDIYDEFAWGVFDPVSIRDFLFYAWKQYKPSVRYCCLLGDTIWKFKNLTESQKGKHYVPSIFHVDDHGCTATDDFYTWFESIPIPYLAIGRLCVNDTETAKTVVDKIIEYERNPEMGIWHNRALFIADDERNIGGLGEEISFSAATEDLESGNYIPRSLQRKKIMEIEYPLKNLRKPDATEELLGSINDGYLLMNFIGHGNIELLAHEHILEGPRDIERINNGPRQSVFFIASCEVAHFDRIETVSLAEMLHLRKEGGCVAVIASSRKTYNVLNVALNMSFYLNLFDHANNIDLRLGNGLRIAKIMNYTDSNANRYILLGDPATRLMIPRKSFAIANIDTVYRLQKLDLSGNVTDGSNPVSYNGTLYITAQGPKIRPTYTTSIGKKILYSLPGKTFYQGQLAISGTGFNSALIVPKDLAPTGNDSRIYFFASGEKEEAAGIIENFLIGDLYSNAPDDVTGPEITLAFDGKNFEEGDYIGRQPTLSANITDPSGVNIYGNRGHNITLMIDNSEIVVLTDHFKNINSYTKGTLSYVFPILSPGEHSFELSAYDTYNNISKKVVTTNVVGSETGDIAIENLLNYPNPMNSDGTTFTFNLNDDAGNAKIKIFSQSGRMVDDLSFSAGYGYNTVFWKPSFSLANGVYFYKLTVWSHNGRKSSKIEKLVVMR